MQIFSYYFKIPLGVQCFYLLKQKVGSEKFCVRPEFFIHSQNIWGVFYTFLEQILVSEKKKITYDL